MTHLVIDWVSYSLLLKQTNVSEPPDRAVILEYENILVISCRKVS